ncbi:MAG: putative flippase GtrA [Candidatus Aldehydirespiratoraceae bacterium]
MTPRIVSPGGFDRPASQRFALVGLIATAVDFGLAVGLVEGGVPRFAADLIALTLAAIVSLRLHATVTLRGDTLDRWIRQPTVFAVVAMLAGAVDIAIFVSLGSRSAWVAKLVALGSAAVLRALAHRLVLFRAVQRSQDNPSSRPPAPGSVRLSIVVPAFHESSRIGATIARIREELSELHEADELEIVVVDDGSTDDTAAVAQAAGADQVVVQPRNRGKGAAVRAGVAVSNGRTVAFTDADLAYAPRQILPMLEAIEVGWDVVIGNRHDNNSETLVGTSALRLFGSRVVNMATSIMLLGNYRDTQCGCKAFRSDVAKVVMGAGQIDGFAFDIEILHLVERYGFTLKEVPVEVVNSETSTVRALHDGLLVGRDILRIRRIATRGGYPSLSANAVPTGIDEPNSTGK